MIRTTHTGPKGNYAPMNYLSLFSGIGGFDLGFDRAGMNCIGQCERDVHAQNVLRHHWPDVQRSDDVQKITGSTFDVRPDLICGGFPCQDLSVAGKRAGLAGGRSGLWFEYHRIIAEIKPQWVVVENVSGLLSSQEGRDFAILVRGLDELGYMGIWKTFDSQYFGVAQRRRRVFIIGHLGTPSRSEILFESESVRRNPAEGRKAGKGASHDLAPCLASSGRGVERGGESRRQDPVIACFGGNRTSGPIDVATACNACGTSSGRQDFETETFVAHVVGTFGVRRLTPKECERLQGFPDDWTRCATKPDGTVYEQSDTQRYRQLGNAVTGSVALALGKMILGQ